MVDLGAALGATRRPYGDTRPWTTGQVVAVDDASGRLEVLVDGARTVLPRVDGQYRAGDTVLVVRDPDASGSGQVVAGTIGHTADPAWPTTGTVTSVGSTTVTVSATGGPYVCRLVVTTVAVGDLVRLDFPNGEPWVLGKVVTPPAVPATPGTPSLSRSGNVLTATWSAVANATTYLVRSSPDGGASWGGPFLTTGPSWTSLAGVGQTWIVQVAAQNGSGTSAWSASSAPVTYPDTPTTEQFTTVIRPEWSGTWRADRGAWDRWNTDRYGGRSTLYQGSLSGAGPMTGMAAYGTQVRDLGAISVDAITVTLPGAGLNSPPTTITLIGTVEGSQPGGAPTGVGSLASVGQPSVGAVVSVALGSDVCELLRTGGAGGLATVGSGYGAVLGTGAADGMALTVTYTRYV